MLRGDVVWGFWLLWYQELVGLLFVCDKGLVIVFVLWVCLLTVVLEGFVVSCCYVVVYMCWSFVLIRCVR